MKATPFGAALKSFLGHLEGTGKSSHTIKNYRLDLLAFEGFLGSAKGDRERLELAALTLSDLEKFHDGMKVKGLKNNTRRRKLMTVRKFLGYLAGRKKIPLHFEKSLPTPPKLEKIPEVIHLPDLLNAIHALGSETEIIRRNRALLWALAETGCLVSEISTIRRSHVSLTEGGAVIEFFGKASRRISISSELAAALLALPEILFTGFNKFGTLGTPITSRGVELLVKVYGPKLGLPHLTPRMIRHSAAVSWQQQGLDRKAIRERLGLKSDYAFRVYEVLFTQSSKSTTEATSTP